MEEFTWVVKMTASGLLLPGCDRLGLEVKTTPTYSKFMILEKTSKAAILIKILPNFLDKFSVFKYLHFAKQHGLAAPEW